MMNKTLRPQQQVNIWFRTLGVFAPLMLFAVPVVAADAPSDDLKEGDPWYRSQGWPSSRSVNREKGRTWWDVEQSEWPQWERGMLRVGAMVTDFDTSIQLSLNGALGISLDGEELLGLESNTSVYRADGMWRFGKRKRNTMDFTLSSHHRDATATAQTDIDLGNGEVIPIGARLDTLFNFDLFRLTYTYAFFQDKRFNVAAGLGVYVAPVEYGLTFTPLNGSPLGFDRQDATLPLPALALRGQYRITPKFYLITDLDFMYLSLDNFEGTLIDLRLSAEYQIWRYFGLGIGYNLFDIEVSSTQKANYIGEFVGELDVKFGGLILYGKFSF